PGRVSQGISLICSAQPCLKHPVLWEEGKGSEGVCWEGTRRHDVCPGLLLPVLEGDAAQLELGLMPGSRDMLLFGLKDPWGPSIARVTMSIKLQTWPAASFRHSRQPFVEATAMSPGVLYMKMREPLVIPCRVTNPNITTTLVKVSHLSIPIFLPSWGLKSFFYLMSHFVLLWSITPITVNRMQGDGLESRFTYPDAFCCTSPSHHSCSHLHYHLASMYSKGETDVKGAQRALWVPRWGVIGYRRRISITEVYLNTSGSVQALKGERLALNCTATTELNTRVDITWDYPGKVRTTFNYAKTGTGFDNNRSLNETKQKR
ncbi:hypothetical protein GOODEAATRI_013425, partial [Goodea atripinnis]